MTQSTEIGECGDESITNISHLLLILNIDDTADGHASTEIDLLSK